eukprot:ctg_6089.g543
MTRRRRSPSTPAATRRCIGCCRWPPPHTYWRRTSTNTWCSTCTMWRRRSRRISARRTVPVRAATAPPAATLPVLET